MTACAEYRPFLGAVADGEGSAAPPATIDHVRTCPGCAHEVELQRAVARRLREAAEEPATERRPLAGRRRASLAVAGVLLAAILAAGAAFALNLGRPDPVLAAAQVSKQPAQFTSPDGNQVGAWCAQASGRAMPDMQLPPLQPVGARMDHQAGTGIVTVYYLSPEGQRLTVSWLDGDAAPAASRTVSSRMVDGRLILVARSSHGTAVITGQTPAALLWSTAAQVEDGT